jgi:hypothetical protein
MKKRNNKKLQKEKSEQIEKIGVTQEAAMFELAFITFGYRSLSLFI